MARELVQKTVDDRLYEFEQFNTTTALKTLAKLTKIVGEPLMIALGALGLEKPDAPGKLVNGVPEPVKKRSLLDTDLNQLNTAVLGKAVAALIDRLDETEVVAVVRLLTAEKALCDHKPILFDDHYVGAPGHLFKVLRAALEAQYGNFLGAVTGGADVSAARPVSIRQ